MSNHLLIGIAEEKTEGKLCLTTYDWNCRGEDRGQAMSNHLLIGTAEEKTEGKLCLTTF